MEISRIRQIPSTEGDTGAPAVGNAPPAKKEKGQARRERRAAAAAAAAAAGTEGSNDEGGDVGEDGRGSVGAYVHISRISDERMEHVEKSYKPGQKVPPYSTFLPSSVGSFRTL